MDKRTFIMSTLAGGLTLALPALAQTGYPQRPIRMVIPFAAGGGTDVLGRLLAQKMGEGLKQAIVVDNKPGAGGSVGTADIAKAPADGYHILLGSSSTHGINPVLYSKLPYDAVKDFAPIGVLATNKFVMAVPADFPAKNLQEFLAVTRANPSKYTYASSGNGTTSHLAGALFAQMSGIPLTHIPYKSNVPGLNDLIAGRVSVMFDNITAMQGQLKAGLVRAIATTGDVRSPILPDVPTMEEQGLKGYRIGGWFILLAPAGTPKDIVERLQAELARVVRMPEVNDKMIAIGADPYILSPEDSVRHIAAEIPRWRGMVETAGAKVE
jgi:tripartite-type tricarboxylate transporter receptor subunit TctC